jgi:hypothetical protein
MTHVTLLDELFDINVIQVSLSDTIVIIADWGLLWRSQETSRTLIYYSEI